MSAFSGKQMNLQKVYHRLPPAFRSLAASARGAYLRAWRYGPEHEKLVAEALERESWTAARWTQWREERLAYMLYRAAVNVPYYRTYWSERRGRGDNASFEYLENWPILEKETVRENPEAFVADDRDIRHMFHEHTSGTTGKSLDLYWSRETVHAWYALWEARSRRWYDVSRQDRWVNIGGQIVVPVEQRKPPFWVWNFAFKQLYMSSYHLADDLIPHYLDAIKAYRIKYLWGYTSSIYALAEYALRTGRSDLDLAVVITNAEPVFDYQRKVIEAAFQCSLRETYGMAEIVAAAGECREGRLHLWPEAGHVEIFEGGEPARPGISGDLVCTGLLNADMPLVRYRLGDRGALGSADEVCRCGRSLPVLAGIEGRRDDVLYTADGRRIGRLDPIFKTRLPIIEAQIIQEALDHVHIRLVPAPNYTDEAGESIVSRLRDRMGPIRVTLEKVSTIPREPNGKFRAVVSHVRPVEKSG